MPDETSHTDDLFDLLRQVHSVLDRHEVWHCLLFGTLLGAVRDGDLIPWDHDLDLLIRPADARRIVDLNGTLAAENLWFWTGKEMAGDLAVNPRGVPWFDPGYLAIMRGGSCYGELYAPSLFADGVLRLYDFEQEVSFWPQSSFPAFLVDELDTVPVRGELFPAPARAEQLLEWQYGPDWRVPYRSVRDGGEAREDHTRHGDVAHPDIAEQIAWCEGHGWDRSVFRGQPAWPRELGGAGPADSSPRTADTSRSAWWHTLEELGGHY